MGASRWQMLRTVQLPMARRTIIVGLNQCTMAALSMATIAALINGPGLGQPVAQALQSLDIGDAFVSGIAIVIMAIVLDRTTTAASERAEVATRRRRERAHPQADRPDRGRGRRAGRDLPVPAVAAAGRVPGAARPRRAAGRRRHRLHRLAGRARCPGSPRAIADVVSTVLLNPLQSLLADSPWWLMFLVVLALSPTCSAVGGPRSPRWSACWSSWAPGCGTRAMKTLTTTLVATLAVIVFAMVVGVWMGRNRRADTGVRPFLDAFQTIPPFVYLVPALALFGPSRFTAIVAAVAFGMPVATKLIADGIRGVSPTSVEAARASGTTAWQMISKVQLPMAQGGRRAGVQPGPAVRALDGGHRWPGRWGRPRLLRGRRASPSASCSARGWRQASPSPPSGIMLDRIAQYAAARYGRR